MRSPASAVSRNGPLRLTSMTLSNSPSVTPASPPSYSGDDPALLTRTSSRPNSSRAASSSGSSSSQWPTWQPRPITRRPVSAAISAAAASQASALRLAIITSAPARARPRAISRPSPRLPPVTRAVRPTSSNTGGSLSRFAPTATTELFDPVRVDDAAPSAAGYVDLLGHDDPTGAHPGQRLMINRVLPLIYERLWRPLGTRIFLGAMGPGMRGEHRIALEMLALERDDRVLDVACGPGNFTRTFARAAPEGVVVGLDASKPMLDRAVVENNPPNVSYVRGDAHALPFRDDSFDAICCFAALYFIEDPYTAVDEIVRVLAPGGGGAPRARGKPRAPPP